MIRNGILVFSYLQGLTTDDQDSLQDRNRVIVCHFNVTTTRMFVTYKIPNKSTEVCQPAEIKYLSSIVAVGDMLLYWIIPSLIIIPSNILIILTLVRSKGVTNMTDTDNTKSKKMIHKVIPMLFDGIYSFLNIYITSECMFNC